MASARSSIPFTTSYNVILLKSGMPFLELRRLQLPKLVPNTRHTEILQEDKVVLVFFLLHLSKHILRVP